MKFYDWILRFQDVNLPIGDLARDIKADQHFPKELSTWNELQGHIGATNGPVYDTAKNAFNYFLAENHPQ